MYKEVSQQLFWSWRWWTPHFVSLIGGILSLWFIHEGPVWAALVGQICDVLDGYLARKISYPSDFGEKLDRAIDISVCASACTYTVTYGHSPIIYLLVLLGSLAYANQGDIRWSGRAFAIFLLLFLREIS